MNEIVLVTGGYGLVGSNLIPKLVKKGYKVRVLDDLSRGRREYLDGVDHTSYIVDIRDIESCAQAFKDVKKVVHLAAYGNVVESVGDPRENFDINVLGTFNVLSLAVKYGVEKMVFSSTGGALIGNAAPPVNERSLPKPISPYGAGKLCCEAYCHAFSESYGLNTVCLRFANVYGPNSYHKTGVINKFFHAIKNNKPLTIYGDGASTRDYIHVSDLTDGIALALANDEVKNEVLHIASGKEVSLNNLANTIISVSGKHGHSIEYKEMRKGEVDRNFASYGYAEIVLGFKPTYTLKQGLQELWDSYEW